MSTSIPREFAAAEGEPRLKAADDVRTSEFLYRTLAESAQDFIYIVNLDREIEYLNRFAQVALRIPPGVAPGSRLDAVLPPEALKLHEHGIDRIRLDGKVYRTEGRLDLGGQSLWLDYLFVPLKDAGDRVHSVLVIARDVSEKDRVHRALEAAVQRLEGHSRAKSEFVSSVSHELKTPLTSMSYAVRNLLKGIAGPVSDDVARYLRLFDSECQRMLKTVNDILDLRRIETGSLVLARTPIQITRLVSRSVEALRPMAEAKMLSLTVACESTPGCADCDPEKTERVVQNIVGNAIKFTPAGGAIQVRVGHDPSEPGQVWLEVEDDGIGIPPEAIQHVTELYFRAGNHPSGSGLGLAISKQIVDLHGGSLRVFSPPPGRDRGTRVRVCLPKARPPQIMAVDDDPLIRRLLEVQLTSAGYEIQTAASGEEALTMALAHRPDALIVDLILTGMSGTELILQMKSRPEFNGLPILAVTGGNIDKSKFSILSSFAIPTFSKPWDEENLFDQIENALIGATIFAKQQKT